MEKIKHLLDDIREGVNLDAQFYGWIFGIQQKLFAHLANFKADFEIEVKNKKI